jgi:hypothetical protein
VNLRELTREQKMLGAAAACGLFVISLFLPWYGAGGSDVSGDDVVPSFWIFLVMSLAAGGILAAEAFDTEIHEAVKPVKHAALLVLFPFVITLAIFLEGSGGADRKYGLFLALIFSLAAVILTLWLYREES